MSSDLFTFDGSFFNDPFSTFNDSSAIDILQPNPDPTQQNPIDETNYFDQISSFLLSPSPPSHQLENLTLSQTIHLANSSISANGYSDSSISANGYSEFSSLEVKTEECQAPFYSPYDYNNSFVSQSYDATENAVKMMQRSFSSHSFDGKPSFLFQPRFDSLMESPNFQPQVLSSPENSLSSGQMRRVCSTGDLQNIKTSHRLSSSPLATESSFMEEANSKVGRYTAEERKERIHRYRAKRNHRNFNKTIKYACRKTLADNRPRIRGRFARNDEAGEISKPTTFNRYEDEDDPWTDGFPEEDNEGTVCRGPLFNTFGPTQFQYYGYIDN